MQEAAPTALIVTVGDELTSGDVENTNASWLARRLEALGVRVRLVAAIRDDVEAIAAFLRLHRAEATHVLVTGGLGGTPDDVTREGVAAAFGVACALDEAAAGPLRAGIAGRLGEYALRWATLPLGSVPVENPLGGAPAFQIENVWVLPGLPAEMRACFEAIAPRFSGRPILQARLQVAGRESDIVAALLACERRYPTVGLGSYPSFDGGRARVELVLKSSDAALLDEAVAWLRGAVAAAPAGGG